VGDQLPRPPPEEETGRYPDDQRGDGQRRRLPLRRADDLPADAAHGHQHREVAAVAAHRADEDHDERPEGEDDE
jgi:hypothetical protein